MPLKGSIQFVDVGSILYRKALDLRYRVLRKPLGLNFTAEQLAAEHADKHLVYMLGEVVLGCLILTAIDHKTLKMRQVAVDDNQQGYGIGTAMVAYSEQWAFDNGFTNMMCHARDVAVPFYQKQGWQIVGEPFTEVGIKHYLMQKVCC